jgi:hypothetical protein
MGVVIYNGIWLYLDLRDYYFKLVIEPLLRKAIRTFLYNKSKK